jgi:hypothetical protein
LLELEAQKMPKDAALKLMQQRMGWYDPRVLDATFACFDIYLPDISAKSQGQPVAVKDLRAGQIVLADIVAENGKTLVMARSRITPVLLVRLANLAKFSPIQEPIYIEPPIRDRSGLTVEARGEGCPRSAKIAGDFSVRAGHSAAVRRCKSPAD